ncbi:iron uptake porin [Merismopedia glauca]|uniref:SLH domain-containing protein n=1 Tax=Merismopedia glauca CCAP 1448/3 TaxID=1296344 RepID=A0A2T1CA60_9CYAN|nr:iron uptake porin [Merismopedia glauca]PSB05160.1 hypothetical protein C7B64_00495 [Merismopedia glauca CCAP 1448/3]
MSKLFWNTIKVSPSLLGAYLLFGGVAIAAPEIRNPSSTINSEVAQATPVDTTNLEQIQQYSNPDAVNGASSDSMNQVTNVSQFSDVQSTDWAYEALSRVVEKYGCLQGYPDGTYRGKRALSRYEFAAGLNACLRQIEALIEAKGQNYVLKEDFEALQRLVEEFRTELATLGSRVDNLEARTDFLESHQFSTTTKLNGEVIFAIADVFGDTKASVDANNDGVNDDLDVNTIFSNRVRLNLDTSFTGKDRLRTRLQARNTTSFSGSALTGTNMTRLGFDGDEGNDVFLSRLQYQAPLGDKVKIILEANGFEWNDTLDSFAGAFESSGTGSISRFGRFNPIYRQSRDGAGAAIRFDLSKSFGLSFAYAAPGGEANNPNSGLFNGSYAALAQVAFKPSDSISLGLTYVRSLNQIGEVDLTGGTGSALARRPFGNGVETTSNQFGVEALFRPSKSIQLSGWVGFTDAQAEDGTGRNADIWNYAVALGFPDLGKKGNLLGFVFGMPPKATSIEGGRADQNTSLHIEGFYRYRLTDNIEITPGLFVLLNPEHNDNNDTQYVGVIRTTFKF